MRPQPGSLPVAAPGRTTKPRAPDGCGQELPGGSPGSREGRRFGRRGRRGRSLAAVLGRSAEPGSAQARAAGPGLAPEAISPRVVQGALVARTEGTQFRLIPSEAGCHTTRQQGLLGDALRSASSSRKENNLLIKVARSAGVLYLVKV